MLDNYISSGSVRVQTVCDTDGYTLCSDKGRNCTVIPSLSVSPVTLRLGQDIKVIIEVMKQMIYVILKWCHSDIGTMWINIHHRFAHCEAHKLYGTFSNFWVNTTSGVVSEKSRLSISVRLPGFKLVHYMQWNSEKSFRCIEGSSNMDTWKTRST